MIKSLVSYSLSLTLLVATLHVPVIQHTCHLFDVTDVSLYAAEKCCDFGEKEDQTTFDVNCCSLDTKLFKADLNPEIPVFHGQDIHFDLPFEFKSFNFFVPESYQLAAVYTRPPPLPANRTLHNLIQVYRL